LNIDFSQMMHDFNIPHVQSNEWVNITCPFCEDHGQHGGLNTLGGYYNCFRCGGHSVVHLLSELFTMPHYEITKLLEQYSGSIALRKKIAVKSNAKKIVLPCAELNARCRKYLYSRNFDPDILQEKYHLTGATVSGEWAGRLIIPMYYQGSIVSFQGRALLSKRRCKALQILRYKTLSHEQSVIDPKSILYNLDNCKEDYIIVTEGASDVWRWGDNCAATLGTSVTREQLLLLLKYEKICIIFDPELEAQKRAEKLGNALRGLGAPEVWVYNTEKKYDIGDSSNEEIKALKKEMGI